MSHETEISLVTGDGLEIPTRSGLFRRPTGYTRKPVGEHWELRNGEFHSQAIEWTNVRWPYKRVTAFRLHFGTREIYGELDSPTRLFPGDTLKLTPKIRP